MMNLSMVIPLPGTDMWEALSIRQKMHSCSSRVPDGASGGASDPRIEARVLAAVPRRKRHALPRGAGEALLGSRSTASGSAQTLIMQSYDAFNADAAQTIKLERPDADALWHYRERVVDEFYGGSG